MCTSSLPWALFIAMCAVDDGSSFLVPLGLSDVAVVSNDLLADELAQLHVAVVVDVVQDVVVLLVFVDAEHALDLANVHRPSGAHMS